MKCEHCLIKINMNGCPRCKRDERRSIIFGIILISLFIFSLLRILLIK